MKKTAFLLAITSIFSGNIHAQQKYPNEPQTKERVNNTESERHFKFALSEKVIRKKVEFKNRYGILLAGHLYIPKTQGHQLFPAIALSEPFGAVKKQSSGL